MKRILIVEDEPDIAESIKNYLIESDYEVEVTLDPNEGVRKLPGFDLLLLDLIMPKLSGREVLNEMKKKGIDKPVIVLSAVGLPETVGEEISKQYPGTIFIAKTEMHAKLLQAVREKIGE
jgi:DNA-binding response OmpR family regulator